MPSKEKSKLWKNLFVAATLVLSAGVVLYFLFSNNGIATLGHIVAALRIRWLLLAIASAAACWLLEGFVLHIICRHLTQNWDYGRSLSVGMIGLLYSALTPSATGGQPMQVYTMHNMGMDTGVACSAVAVKTLVYQIVMVFYALVMVIMRLQYFQTNVSNFSFVTILGLLLNSLFIASVFLFMISEKLTDRILRALIRLLNKMRLCRNPEKRYEKIHSELQQFHDASKMMGSSAKLYFSAAVFTVLQISLNSMIPYFIYRSFNLHGAQISTMIAAQVFVSMVSAFVPLPGASGGAESCFFLFFGPYFGTTIWSAIFLWRVITYYFNILFGGMIGYLGSKSWERKVQKRNSQQK